MATNAGFVDAAGYVALVRLFTANQSGNTVGLGVALGSGDWTDTWRRLASLGGFVAGIAVGTAMVEIYSRHRPRRAAAVLAVAQMTSLVVALAVGEGAPVGGRLHPAETGAYAVAAIGLAVAMGLQTVSLRRVGNRTVRTTFVTGVLTNMAEAFVVSLARHDGGARRRISAWSGLLASVWVMYLAGGVAGGVAERAWSFAALGVPVVVTAGIAVWDLRFPYHPDLPSRGLEDPQDRLS